MRAVVAPQGKVEVVERPKPVAGPKEVVIQIHATALNRADLLQAQGKYPPPVGASDILGLECAGTIAQLGSQLSRKDLCIGDKVAALLAGGGYAEYVAVDENQVLLVKNNMDMKDAAAVPEVWLTAFQLLHWVAKLTPQDSLLIHAGASGVGTAAIQLAKAHGLQTIIVTVGSDEKAAFCKNLGATHAFNYKNGRWSDKVLDATNRQGVSVIMDCIGFPYADQNAEAIGMDGRWVLFGLMGGAETKMEPILGPILRKRIQLLGSTLRARSVEYKGNLVKAFEGATKELFANGTLRPVRDCKEFRGLESIGEAHAYMQTNTSKGKIILSVL